MPAGVPFTITALCGGEPRRATRMRAASAMVLADSWTAAGCQAVRVTDPHGISRDQAGFRVALLGYLKRARRAP